MGVTSKMGITKGAQTFAKAWDCFNAQVFDYKNDTKNIAEFALAERGNHALRIIDLGCGAGHYDFLLTRLGYKCLGVDKNPDIIEYARHLYPSLNLRCCDILSNQLESMGRFDMVLCKHLTFPFAKLKIVLRKARALAYNREKSLLCFDFLVLDNDQKLAKEISSIAAIDNPEIKGKRESKFSLLNNCYVWNEKYSLNIKNSHKVVKFNNQRKLYFITEQDALWLLDETDIKIRKKLYEVSGIDGLTGMGIYGVM